MISLDIPMLMVGAFLSLTLIVALFCSKKAASFRDYAIGSKQFPTATLVATVLATYYGGGGLMRNVQCVYKLGLVWIIKVLFCNSFSIWLFSRLMFRMGPFMQHFSIAETVGSVYGSYPRMIAALFAIGKSLFTITIQILVMVQAVGMCVNLALFNAQIVTMVATLILIFYSMFGGVRAVTITDLFQFITFSVVIPFLACFMFKQTGRSVADVVAFLQTQESFQFSSLYHFDVKLARMVAIVLCVIVPDIGVPPIMQKTYMASSPNQAKKVFAYTAFLSFIISSFILLIGLLVFVEQPALPSEAIWPYIMAHISPLFKGMVCVSLLAMAMSTADSCLNACAVIFSHDIWPTLQKGKKVTHSHQLEIARWTTLVVGLFSMLLTFYCKDLLDLLMFSFAFYLPVITAPSLLAIFGFRGTSRTALLGMATGALAILAWNKWVKPTTGIDGAFVCMLANGLAMMAAHYLLKQPEGVGWIRPQHNDLLPQKHDDLLLPMQQETHPIRPVCKTKMNIMV